MPTPAHSLRTTLVQSLPTFLRPNELLCDLHLWLYKIQVLPVCLLDFSVPISLTEEEEEEESHYHHIASNRSLPKVVSAPVCDVSYSPAAPDLVCPFSTTEKTKTCPSSTSDKPGIDIDLFNHVWKPNKVTMHVSLLAAAFLQPCLVLYEGKPTKFSDLLSQIYNPRTHATNTNPFTLFSVGPILMCIRKYIISLWRKTDKLSECSESGGSVAPTSQQYNTSHKNEMHERRRGWGKKRRKRRRKRYWKRSRKAQRPWLENTSRALKRTSGEWRLETEHKEKPTDSGIGSSITISISQPEQSAPPQHYPSPMKDGPMQMACALVMGPMQETVSETPANGQDESLPLAKQEEYSTHSENYGPTEAGEEYVEPSPEIKVCPSLCEAEHASIDCDQTNQLPEKACESEKHSVVVLPQFSSGAGAVCQSESFTTGGCGEVADHEDSDHSSQNMGNPPNCTNENSHPLGVQESGENEDEESEALHHANSPNSSMEFLRPTHHNRFLLPPCTSETSRHHLMCSVCVNSGTPSIDTSVNYPEYKHIQIEAAVPSVNTQLNLDLIGQQPSQEETGETETMRVESHEGRSGPTAFFLPPRPLHPSQPRPLSPSSDPLPVSRQTRAREEDLLSCRTFSSPHGDTPPDTCTIILDTTAYQSLQQVRE